MHTGSRRLREAPRRRRADGGGHASTAPSTACCACTRSPTRAGPGFSSRLLLGLGCSRRGRHPFILIQWNLKRCSPTRASSTWASSRSASASAPRRRPSRLAPPQLHSLASRWPLLGWHAGPAPLLSTSTRSARHAGPHARGQRAVRAAMVIMTGSPPFGIFFSELIILRAGFAGPHRGGTASCSPACAALLRLRVPVGPAGAGSSRRRRPAGGRRELDVGSLTLMLTACGGRLGLYLPPAAAGVIHAAVKNRGGRTMSATETGSAAARARRAGGTRRANTSP